MRPKKSPSREKFQNGGSFRKASDPRVNKAHEAPTTEPLRLAASKCKSLDMPRVTNGKSIYLSGILFYVEASIAREDLPSAEAFGPKRHGSGLESLLGECMTL